MKKFKLAIILLSVSVYCVSTISCTDYQLQRDYQLQADYQLQIDFPSEIPSSYLIEDVPFVEQKPYYCAPASAEMVLRYHSILKFDQDAIAKSDMFNPTGTHWDKLLGFLNWHGKQNGFGASKKYGNLDTLKKYIASDYPIIVRQWKSLKKKTRHYRVVMGYDDEKNKIICHDPRIGPEMTIDYDTFVKLWDVQTGKPHWSSKNLMIIIGRRPIQK